MEIKKTSSCFSSLGHLDLDMNTTIYATWSWMNDTNFDVGAYENILKHHLKITYFTILTKAIAFVC